MAERKEFKTISFPGMVANVYIPDIPEEERTRRMQSIHMFAERLLKAEIERSKRNDKKSCAAEICC